MVEETTVTTPAQPAETAAPVVSPAEPSPPLTESAPSPSVVEPPSVTPPAVETPAAVAPATLLGADPIKPDAAPAEVKPTEDKVEAKPEEIKPEEKKPEAEASEKKDEASQSVEPAPLPSYDAFTLPEGVTVDNERLTDFTKTLAEFETLTKAPHAEVQKFAQGLVDRHVAEVQDTVKRLNESYVNAWQKQVNDWKDAFEKDPEIGLNRRDTTLAAANEFISTHCGNEAQQAEFRGIMQTSGLGNHPAMIRTLANAMNAYREGKPVPAAAPVKGILSKIEKRYGTI